MSRNKSHKSQVISHKSKFKILSFTLWFLAFSFTFYAFAQEQFVYDAKGKRNPFIPLVTPDGRLLKLETQENLNASLLVEGIIYDKNGLSYAIVNGSVVSIGDTVGDFQVLKIEDNKVIFIKDGLTQEIELKKEEP